MREIKIILISRNQPVAMKKFINTLLLIVIIPALGCHSNNIANISSGVKVIDKCCKKLSMATGQSNCPADAEDIKATDRNNAASFLPAYSWDTKMMIW